MIDREAPTGTDGGLVTRPWVVALAAGVLYLTAYRYAVAMQDLTTQGALYWPGAGVSVAALLISSPRAWPLILFAVAAAEFGSDLGEGSTVAAGLGWALANALEALLAAAVVRRLGADRLASVGDVARFVVVAVVLAPAAGALLGAFTTTALTPSELSYATVWLRWVVGDGLGILAITPAAVLLLRNRRARQDALSRPGLLHLLLVSLVVAGAFGLLAAGIGWPYLAVPALLWASVRMGLVGAAISVFITAQIATVATSLGTASFTPYVVGPSDALLSMQVFLIVIGLTVLVIGARTEESRTHAVAARHHRAGAAQLAVALSELGASETTFRGLFDASPVGSAITRLDWRVIAVNSALCTMIGLDEPVLRESDLLALVHPDDRGRLRSTVDELLAGDEQRRQLSVRWIGSAGTFQGDVTLSLLDAGPRASHVVVAIEDVTELRRATAETETMAQRLVATLESISDGFCTVDVSWRVTYVNRCAEALLHTSRSELIDRNIWQALPAAVDTELYACCHRVMAGGELETLPEYYYPPLDAWFTISVIPSDVGLAVYFQDITDQRENSAALVEQGVRVAEQAELLDKASDAIVVTDLEYRISYFNRRAEQLYGWTAREVHGQSLPALLRDDPEAFAEARDTVRERGEWAGETVQRSGAGSEVDIQSRWTLVRDDAGEPRSVLMINSDVTERRRIDAHLMRTQRIDSLGELASGIAHDLNNVLAPIMMSVGLLQAGETDPVRQGLLESVEQSTRRGADIVGQILTFARGAEGRRVPVDIGSALSEVQRLAEDTFLKSIRVVTDVDPDLWQVAGDPTQVHQVVLNLCVNARDAMPEGGNLLMEASNVVVDDNYAVNSPEALPGTYVRIRIEDDGDGMLPEVCDRIFEPFFSTKPQGEGTGLGLSVTAAIVRSHGGFISVESQLQHGSSFAVHLPAVTDRTTAVQQFTPPPLPRAHGEVVLVIDDERHVRNTLAHALRRFGYAVLQASGGLEAEAVLIAHNGDVRVVITDMMMPGLDGPATIERLRRIVPDLPVIAVSGLHAQHPRNPAAGELDVQGFLLKPFTITEIRQTLHDILHGSQQITTGMAITARFDEPPNHGLVASDPGVAADRSRLGRHLRESGA